MLTGDSPRNGQQSAHRLRARCLPAMRKGHSGCRYPERVYTCVGTLLEGKIGWCHSCQPSDSLRHGNSRFLAREGYGAGTLSHIKWMLSAVYVYAKSQGLIHHNPVFEAKWTVKAKRPYPAHRSASGRIQRTSSSRTPTRVRQEHTPEGWGWCSKTAVSVFKSGFRGLAKSSAFLNGTVRN